MYHGEGVLFVFPSVQLRSENVHASVPYPLIRFPGTNQ